MLRVGMRTKKAYRRAHSFICEFIFRALRVFRGRFLVVKALLTLNQPKRFSFLDL